MQVFPLLLRHFSSEEQASLVWRFIGSIPVRLLEEFLPWMISFFNPKDKKDVMDCITKVIPEDKPLQKVDMRLFSNHCVTCFLDPDNFNFIL